MTSLSSAQRKVRDLRLAVYTDFSYRRDEAGVYTDQAFALFVTALADHVDRLVMVGRLEPTPGRWHNRLRDDVNLVPLPHYGRLSDPRAAALGILRSTRHLWRVLDDVDAVWLMGPHPLSILFAALAVLRRKRVTLGVRQEVVQYARNRHPGRRSFLLIAKALEAAYRAMSRAVPIVVVGPELERQYRRARAVLSVLVSVVGEEEISRARPRDGGWDGEIRLLSVGRIEAEKNPLLLADILARLRVRDDRWRLTVCGEGPMLPDLERRLRELGVADNAELKGYVAREGGLAELYRQSDALLHVSWTEGVPGVLLEAFATALPVVATDVGGVRQIAEGSALLVPPGDAQAAADALQRLADDGDLRRRVGDAGLERVRQHTLEAESGRVAAFIARGAS
jgi:glycosyltransferase involved in cell wall biosynthesis